MTAIDDISKLYGEKILNKYRHPLHFILYSSLDSKGSAIKEVLHRKGKIKEGTPFFEKFSDEDLEGLIRELQVIIHKKQSNRALTENEKLLFIAFKRTTNKLAKMGSDFL